MYGDWNSVIKHKLPNTEKIENQRKYDGVNKFAMRPTKIDETLR